MTTNEKKFLKSYDASKYERPSVTADIVICTIIEGTLQVLLIKRKNHPFKNTWAIPGGFLDLKKKETLEETAFRELKEETGLSKGVYLEQLKTYGDPDRDPRTRVITVAYYALISSEYLSEVIDKVQAGDDAKEAEWFPLEAAMKMNLAFDHKEILMDALMRLRGKILYAPIAFKLTPTYFTWTELQRVHEIILGRKLLPSNFRRKIQSMHTIKTLNKKKKNGMGRPKFLLKYMGDKKAL